MNRLGPTLRAGAIVVFALSLSACTTQYRNHGYAPSNEDLSQIQVGRATRDNVEELVGLPTNLGVLKDGAWFYVGDRWAYPPSRRPRPISREIVKVSFNSAGTVTNIERFGLEDGQVVYLSRRVTDSGIKDVSFIRQLFGSFGNIGADALLN